MLSSELFIAVIAVIIAIDLLWSHCNVQYNVICKNYTIVPYKDKTQYLLTLQVGSYTAFFLG